MKKNKTLFACFVDLRKAFDSVWREGLIYKLYQYGISKKFINVMDNTGLDIKLFCYLSDSSFGHSLGQVMG